MTRNTIGNRSLYLFAYKFRNMFIVFAAILFYFAFTESITYSILAVICLGLGVLAHILRNKALKRIKR